MFHRATASLAIAFSLAALLTAVDGRGACLDPPGDVTGDGSSTVVDVQCSVLAVLWSIAGQVGPPPGCIASVGSPAVRVDHNCDGIVNVLDATLGVVWSLNAELPESLDMDSDSCVDACQTDLDGDGDFDVTDCAPHDPLVGAGATEVCNGFDDDCDAEIDGNDSSFDPLDCSDSDPCNGAETCVAPTAVAGLVMTELNVGLPGTSSRDWLEIYNGGNSAVNIRGYVLKIGPTSHTIDPGGAIFIGPKAHLLIGNSADLTANGGLRMNYTWGGLDLPQTSGSVSLETASGSAIDQVNYTAAFGVGSGASAAVIDPTASNAVSSAWATSTLELIAGVIGTPGGPNAGVAADTCTENPPTIECPETSELVVYSSHMLQGTVLKHDLGSGTTTTFYSGGGQVADPWLGPDGTMYLPDIVLDSILTLSPSGVATEFFDFASAGGNPRMIVPGPGNLLYSAGDGQIGGDRPIWGIEFDGTGSVIDLTPVDSTIWDIEFGPDGTMWVSDQSTLNSGQLWKVSPEGEWQVAASGYGRSRALDFGPDGLLYISALTGDSLKDGRVLAFDPESGADPEVVLSNLEGIYGMEFGPSGLLYFGYTETGSGDCVIERMNAAGVREPIYQSSTYNLTAGFAFE